MATHKTSAWPLAWVYVGLIVYASLYPFADWRDQGIAPWAYLYAPWPRYWTWFDLIANALGYAPLGFFWALSALRTGRGKHAVLYASFGAAGLSLLLEAVQSYLPARVPSNVDLALNSAGAAAGAVVAALLEKIGALARWNRFRERWFVPDARGAIVLLALWPFALLFPAAVPLGLGQVLERLEATLADWLLNTPFLDWLPVRAVELQPLVPGAEMICVSLGALIPLLLVFSVVPSMVRRVLLVLALLGVGIGATTLSFAMTYGPAHGWAWFSLPVQVGLGLAAVLGLLLCKVSGRVCAALVLLALGLYLSVLNQAPTSAYFALTLQTWEQGRFIRFHGLAQWLGWAWPYLVLFYALSRVGARSGKN